MTPPTSLLQIAPDRSSRIGEKSRPIELPAQSACSVPGAVSVQRFSGPHPQRAVPSAAQARDVVVGQRGIGGVEDGEVHAVEADQAFFGCQPDVAVPGLRDRADRSLRQAVAGSPVVGGVLGDERARIECRRRHRRSQQEADRQASSQCPRHCWCPSRGSRRARGVGRTRAHSAPARSKHAVRRHCFRPAAEAGSPDDQHLGLKGSRISSHTLADRSPAVCSIQTIREAGPLQVDASRSMQDQAQQQPRMHLRPRIYYTARRS